MSADISEDTARELIEETRSLRADVTTLSESYDNLAERQTDTERKNRVLSWLLAIAILAVAVLGLILWQTSETAAQLQRVTQLGVCPAAAIIVGGASADPRPAESQDAYLAALDSLARSREALGCTDPIVPPRDPKVTR